MGKIKRVIVNEKVPTPEHNNRFVVELCENVHVHYRNLRLEFSKDEFWELLYELRQIADEDFLHFNYGPDQFKELVRCRLHSETEFNDRLQIEEQVEGHFHVHYRNLRIEVNELAEIFGSKKSF